MSLLSRSTYFIFNIILYFYIICGEHGINVKLEELKLWCDGIYISNNIELRDVSSVMGSGFFATQDIESGSTVIQIPIKCCLLEQTIKENQIINNKDNHLHIAPFIYENIFENDTFTAFGMAMYLLQLQKSKLSNPFQPFLRTLPDKPPNIPLFWRPDLIKLIKHTSVHRLLTQQIKVLNEFLNTFDLRNKLNPFMNELLSIYSMVSSRIYTLYSYKATKDNNKNMFIPVIDQINHNPLLENVIFHYNSTQNLIQINVVKYISKNKQLFLNYGPNSNAMLLSQYGFLLNNNLYQFTDNDLYININEINYEKKRNLLHLFPSYLTSNLRFGADGLQLKSAKSYYISSLQANDFNLFTIAIIMAVQPLDESDKVIVVAIDELRRISIAIQNSVSNFSDIELENDLRFALCENGKRLNNVLSQQYEIAQAVEMECNSNGNSECFTIETIETYLNEEIQRLRNANSMYC